MSAYLQRLFDRGAALAALQPAAPAAAGAELAPAMAPGSPAFAFDQRLAEPALARLFSVLGVTPEMQADGEAGLSPDAWAAAAVRPAETLAPPHNVAAPAAPRAPAPAPAPAQGREGPRAVHREMRPTSPALRRAGDVMQAPAWSASEAVPTPAAQPARDIAPADAHAAPLPVAVPVTTGQPVRAVASGQPESPATVRARVQPPEAAPVVPPPAAPQALAPVHPAEVLAPRAPRQRPQVDAPAPVRRPAVEVEPPRRMPAPVAAPAGDALDARAVERIAREVVRTELARRPGTGGASQQAVPGAVPAERAAERKAAAPRPATAREASVIGELEPSSSPLTIYGLRRR